jgi:hypothetical protein
MLYTDPVTNDPVTEHTRVYRRRPLDRTTDVDGTDHEFEAEAFHWGSLTTGHWLTAFWILLGPFAFANVAGWMTNRPGKPSHAGIRLAGLALTCLLVAQLGFVFLETPLALAPTRWRLPALVAGVVIYLLVYVIGIVVWLSTQSHFQGFGWGRRLALTIVPARRFLLPPKFWAKPSLAEAEGQWDDPAGSPITAPTLWVEHAILHRIRRLHLAVGVLVITALIAVGIQIDWLLWSTVGAGAVTALLVILTTTNPRSVVVQVLTAWAPPASLLSFGLALWQLIASGAPAGPWPGYHETVFVIALMLGLASLSALFSGWVGLGAIVIAILFGASLGAGVSYIANTYIGDDQLTENGAGWVSVAMLFLIITIAVTALILSFRGDALPLDGKAMALLRRVTSSGRVLFVVAAVYGLVSGLIAFGVACLDLSCTPGSLGLPERGGVTYTLAIGAFALLVALAAIRAFALSPLLSVAIALIGGAAVVFFATGDLPVGTVAGYEVDFNDLVDISRVLIVILPVLLVGRSLIGSIRRGTSNRQVGVIWDVASMWPRWFHPLAPPAYGPKVLEALAEKLEGDRPDLLEAHSQGSVLAVLALSRAKSTEGISLLTYGSPIGLLYGQMFPRAGVPAMVADLNTRLNGRWRNLWRPTDPLGGAPVGLGEGDIEVEDSTGHSGYELTTSFREGRHGMVLD